jgi:hypothetical protein
MVFASIQRKPNSAYSQNQLAEDEELRLLEAT